MRDLLLSSSFLILGCCMVRRVSMGKISMKHIYCLWMVVAVCLCVIPFQIIQPPSALSILNVVNVVEEWRDDREMASSPDGLQIKEQEERETVNKEYTAMGSTAFPSGSENMQSPEEGKAVNGSQGAEFDFRQEIWEKPIKYNRNPVFWGIWAVGALLVAGWMFFVNVRFKREILQKRVPLGRKRNVEIQEEWMRLPVYLVEDLDSPCLLCVKGEKGIYIPDKLLLEPESLRHAAVHEICHYRQWDLVWNRLRCVLLAVYWFHPLVWLGAWMSRQDCELSCDEAAINLLGTRERFAYGRTLLSLVGDAGRTRGLIYEGTWMTAGARQMKCRISRIAKGSRMTFVGVVGYYFLMNLLIVAACCQPMEERTHLQRDTGNNSSYVNERTSSPEELAGFLTEHHLSYIGDAVGSGRIVGACIRAIGLTAPATTELQTSQEPFAYRLVYREEDRGELDENSIKAVSILAFASIDNMGLLEVYTGPDGIHKEEQVLQISRQEAMELYGLTDLSVYGQSREEMLNLVQMVERSLKEL